MRTSQAALGTTVFFFVAPFAVAGVLPWWIGSTRAGHPNVAVRSIGAVLLIAGFAAVLHSFVKFVAARGTPAPIAPTSHLVVDGFYRYVRNPMYLAVLTATLGQALWFGSPAVLAYALAVWVLVATFVKLYEEPTLLRQFGAEYEDYRRSVPAWIPRVTPLRHPKPSSG